MNDLDSYFDFYYKWKNEKPIFSMSLKKDIRKIGYPTNKTNGKPISSVKLEYFLYYFEDFDLAKNLFEYRKQFFNTRRLFEKLCILKIVPSEDLNKIKSFFEKTDSVMKVNQLKVAKSEEYRKKLSNSYDHERNSQRMKEAWINEESRQKYLAALNKEEIIEKRIKSFLETINSNKEEYISKMNDPNRIAKISKAAKEMWKDAKENNIEKYFKMRRTSQIKNYSFQNIKMNKIEFIIASIINELGYSFEYEKSIDNSFYPDFIIGKNIIECYGDYWHANPNKYKENDILAENIIAKDIWIRDSIRQQTLEDLGYKFHYFWECDINNNQELVKNMIKNILSSEQNKKYIEEETTFEELADKFGIDDLDTPAVYDITHEEYEILSFDQSTGKEVWKPLTDFVVKNNSPIHYKLGTLKGTPKHRVLYQGQYIELENHPEAVKIDEPIQVVDCQVADTHNYIAEGQINHNTTTTGGKSIPYQCSVRLKMTGGQQIKKTVEGKEQVIGINVGIKTIKNRMGPPFREVDFDIIFGKGIDESGNIFDVMREWCDKHKTNPCVVDGNNVIIEGLSQWKTFMVFNPKTNTMIEEVKFHKSDFGEKVLNVPAYKKYMDALMDAAYVMRQDSDHITYKGANMNDAVEAEAVKMEQEGE